MEQLLPRIINFLCLIWNCIRKLLETGFLRFFIKLSVKIKKKPVSEFCVYDSHIAKADRALYVKIRDGIVAITRSRRLMGF
jgi:hypothetical protein